MFISLFSSINATIKPCLNQLNTDTDIDVKFFASEAMLGELFTIYKMFLSLHKASHDIMLRSNQMYRSTGYKTFLSKFNKFKLLFTKNKEI